MDAEPGLGTAYLDALAVVLLEIASLPLVTSVKLSGEPGDKPTNIKVRANVKAEFVALPKSRQPSVCLSQERPTQLEAARGLLEKLRSSDKGGYAQELAAAAAAAAEAPADAGSSSSPSHAPSAFDRLKAASVAHRALKQAVADAERAAREACDAERAATAAREEAEAAAAEAKAALAAFEPRTAAQRDAEAKRQKTRHPREARPYDTYLDVQEWRRQETLQWDRRRVALTDKPARRAEDLKPRGPTGVDGPLNHWRRSVAGAVLDWAEGSRADAAKIVMWTIEHLELEDDLSSLFHPEAVREAETNAFIVDRVKAALDVNKACATEEQRREYLTGLAYVAPPRLASRDKAGMIRRVAERLNVRRGRRSRKQGGRQTAFDRAIDRRTNFDAAALQLLGPLGHVFTEGQKVLTHNGPAEIARLTADGRVVVTYRNGDSYAERTYTSRSGKEPGSARLQPMPPSLLPAPRATSALATSDTTKKAIVDHAHVYCPTSPHQRDVMKRRTGPCTVEEKAALILSDVREAMFADFQEKHPEIKISFSQWKETLKTEVWNMKKAYRSTCLDRVDVNYKWHRETLLVVATMLAIEMEPPQQDADADDREEQPPDALTWHRIGADPPTAVADVDDNAIGEELVNETLAALLTKQTRLTEAEWASCGIAKLHSHHYIKAGDSYFRPAPSLEKQLIEFASLTLMSQVGNALVCSECLGDETADDCLHDRCDRCSFRRIWSNGIRKRIEPDDEFWAQEISWDMLKPGGDSTHGSSDNELRHTVTGTLIDFLDAFEPVQGNWKPHRFHAVQAKVAERELEQNLTPKKLKKDTDWSENGELIVKDQVQSEYWHLKYYSLLITITAFLVTADWEDRESALPAKAEVTVQPEWAVPSEGAPHVTYIKGSFYGTVETGSKSTGEGIEYTVVCNDGSRVVVPRCRLRHRVWHRVAFLGITNEKQHVGLTTQAFHTEELEFWRCWHESGRDAALAYAAADRAAWPSLVPDAEPQTAKGRAAATHLARLDDEQFWALVGHADNATHLKSSANLHYWSNKQDEMSSLNFLKQIMAEYGCPGKGKGPWDGLGAAVKTRIRNAIINEIARKAQTTPSGQITNAIEVAQHLRAIFSTPDWLLKHAHMKINEYVVFYIDKDEFVWPAGDPPIYSTFEGISKRYSFLMRGGGRVGGARYCCWCPACCLAFETGEGMDALLDVAACERRHLMRYEHRGGARFGYEEATITCTQAAGVGNSKVRAKALWRELKPLLKAGKFAAVEARVLWGLEEQVHMRPGHFWACELGNADGKGSPILQGPFKKQQWWPPVEGEAGWKPEYAGIPRYRYDEGECAILLRCYFHRTADDREGLTFLRWPGKAGEKLVINSSELRAVQGRQECDFKLMLPQGSPQLRQQQSRAKKQKRPQQEAPPIDPKQRWRLERDLDRDTRRVCEAT